MTSYPTNTPGYDYDDHDPILPDPNTEDEYFPTPSATPQSVAPVHAWKTVKKVELYRGNLVLDCPVPKKLLALCPLKDEREFTHMRYESLHIRY